MIKFKKKGFQLKKKFKKGLNITERIKKLFRKNRFFIKRKFKKLLKSLFLKKKIDYKINIKIIPNNIFCTLIRLKKKSETILLVSAGILKLKVTKKKLKYISKILIENFLNKIKKIIRKKISILNISGPIKIRKRILRQAIKTLKKNKMIINLEEKKSFNGCRPKKKRRKKRKGLVVRK